jgi:hypothetical protein
MQPKRTIVVVDFDTRNPNVFYETGIAHTLGKHVVPTRKTRPVFPSTCVTTAIFVI